MQSEELDYNDWSDEELAEELDQLDKDLDSLQATLIGTRKRINKFTEHRDKLLDVISQRAHSRKGWHKKGG
jgi:prefoldin subunit 5